jgi:hypothetical protein
MPLTWLTFCTSPFDTVTGPLLRKSTRTYSPLSGRQIVKGGPETDTPARPVISLYLKTSDDLVLRTINCIGGEQPPPIPDYIGRRLSCSPTLYSFAWIMAAGAADDATCCHVDADGGRGRGGGGGTVKDAEEGVEEGAASGPHPLLAPPSVAIVPQSSCPHRRSLPPRSQGTHFGRKMKWCGCFALFIY